MKTVLITGAGSGFGKGAAIELAAWGIASVRDHRDQRSGGQRSASAHTELTALKLDVTDAIDIAQVADIDPDVLVNNAGFGVMAPLASVPLDRLHAGFEVNVFGTGHDEPSGDPGDEGEGRDRVHQHVVDRRRPAGRR